MSLSKGSTVRPVTASVLEMGARTDDRGHLRYILLSDREFRAPLTSYLNKPTGNPTQA